MRSSRLAKFEDQAIMRMRITPRINCTSHGECPVNQSARNYDVRISGVRLYILIDTYIIITYLGIGRGVGPPNAGMNHLDTLSRNQLTLLNRMTPEVTSRETVTFDLRLRVCGQSGDATGGGADGVI